MNTKELTKLYEVSFEAEHQNVYIVADTLKELSNILEERYSKDRFSFSWRDYTIVTEVEKSPEEAIKGRKEPFRVFWMDEDHEVRGLEKRANQNGSKGLYYL